jgi:hypothetical protein
LKLEVRAAALSPAKPTMNHSKENQFHFVENGLCLRLAFSSNFAPFSLAPRCLKARHAQDRTVKKPDNFTELRRRNYQKSNDSTLQTVGMVPAIRVA